MHIGTSLFGTLAGNTDTSETENNCGILVSVADCHLFIFKWLEGGAAEDEGAAEEGEEAEVDPGDDHLALRLLVTTSLFCTGLFFFFFWRECFVNFHVLCFP